MLQIATQDNSNPLANSIRQKQLKNVEGFKNYGRKKQAIRVMPIHGPHTYVVLNYTTIMTLMKYVAELMSYINLNNCD